MIDEFQTLTDQELQEIKHLAEKKYNDEKANADLLRLERREAVLAAREIDRRQAQQARAATRQPAALRRARATVRSGRR